MISKVRNVLKILNVGDQAIVVGKGLFDKGYSYTPITITRKNKTSLYFKYDLTDEFETRVDKYGDVENVCLGWMRFILMNDQEVEQHKEEVLEAIEFKRKRDFVESHVYRIGKAEIEDIYTRITRSEEK